MHMGFMKGLLGRTPSSHMGSEEEQLYAICPQCGAGYKTTMVMDSLLLTDAWLADLDSWTTRVTCKMCRNEIWVSGSHREVYGQRKPG
jgi:hypothetical protein